MSTHSRKTLPTVVTTIASCHETRRQQTLDQLTPLLDKLRHVPGLTEKSRGVFYKSSKAFLHFHEDPSGTHADLRVFDDFQRYRVETTEEQSALLELVRSSVTTETTVRPGAAPEG